MGLPATTPFTPQGELRRPDASLDAEAQRAAAFRQRSELAAAQAAVRARAAETGLARAARRADLELEAERERLSRGGGSVGIGVTLPCLDWGRRRAEIQQAEAAAQAQQAHLSQQ